MRRYLEWSKPYHVVVEDSLLLLWMTEMVTTFNRAADFIILRL